MASSVAMKLSFVLLLTLFSSMKTQARDSQFFDKVSSTTTNVAPNKEQPLNNQQQEPNFLPENENGYGLYSHESGQLPPSATTTTAEPTTTTSTTAEPLHKYLPKNYNPVAYVTEPENVQDSSNSFSEDTYTNSLKYNDDENSNYKDGQNYYDNQADQKEYQTREPKYRSYTANTFTANNRYSNDNFNYNGGSSFNSGPQGLSDTRFDSRENNFYNGEEESSFQPQGMSDTRSLENGKYFYDINNEKYSENHPYEGLKGVRATNEYNDRNYYGNSYQNQYEFPKERICLEI
ncbi:uncharacterized protein [Primulina eburnea]|uniref:uncharacterized protein n=1 Tax=Primulina eburnea TaxID=1245227 RepID=UPI003C6C58E0